MLENRILLASNSPRRRELLRLITADFECVSADADESLPDGITPQEAVLYLSKIKAQAFSPCDKIIIGADTVVALNGKIIGKPENDEYAFEILSSLSGKVHSVFTGVTIISWDHIRSFYEKTDVEFYQLSQQEIRNYIQTGECSDKAGAYGIQGRGALLVKRINGDYYNVVGLPVARLYRELICC